jgi:hypothetical protein
MSEPMRRVSSVSRMMSTPMVRIARLMIGEERGEHRAADAEERGRPEPEALLIARDEVGAQEDQRAVHEADDLAGLEDDHEAERDERVDRTQAETVDQQGQELGHDGDSSCCVALGSTSSPEPR